LLFNLLQLAFGVKQNKADDQDENEGKDEKPDVLFLQGKAVCLLAGSNLRPWRWEIKDLLWTIVFHGVDKNVTAMPGSWL
jgi:hypothetical protein